MPSDRLRSIVPMFGGGDRYVETLNEILAFVDAHQPTTDEFVEWHRGAFNNVSSRNSIMRRVSYLQQIGFLECNNDRWTLGKTGEEYASDHEIATLLRIMCNRNVGLRSLLYALSADPLTIDEISDQQLDTHPELGWSRGQTDMAKQRANWLRSMGLVEKNGDQFDLTTEGETFVHTAVKTWADTEWMSSGSDEKLTASTYETVTYARAVDPEFRATVLSRYNTTCPVSGVDHAGLLDVAHVLPWSEHPNHRANLSNVLPLSKTHHAAFDRGLFTIDGDYRIRINPSFKTDSDVLRQTIVDQAGERIPLPDGGIEPGYFEQRNSALDWF